MLRPKPKLITQTRRSEVCVCVYDVLPYDSDKKGRRNFRHNKKYIRLINSETKPI